MPVTGWDMTTIYFLVGQAANLVGVILAPVLSPNTERKEHICWLWREPQR
jgi:hypothetical protein